MLIATFRPSTGWHGKSISFEDEQFVLEGHGPVAPSAIVEYDEQGHLEWSSDGLRQWVHEQAAQLTPTPPPPAQSGPLESTQPTPASASDQASESPEAATTAAATPPEVMRVATFREGTSRAGKTIIFEQGAFVLEGEGGRAAADVMEFDRLGQLVWAVAGTRAWVGAKAADLILHSATRELLHRAGRQYESGKYKAAVETLWYLDAQARQGDEEAASGVIDLATEIGGRVSGRLADECADLVQRSRSACRGEKVRVGPKASEEAADAAEPPPTARAPVTVLPLAPPPAVAASVQLAPAAVAVPPRETPLESSPLTRKRLDTARKRYEEGRYKAAIGILWEVEPDTRAGDVGAARMIVDLAGLIREHVGGKLGEECAELIERSTKAMQPAADSGGSPRPTPTPSAETNIGLMVGGYLVIVVGIVLIIGNVSGAAPTFAFAGFLTTLVGGLMVGAGRGNRS